MEQLLQKIHRDSGSHKGQNGKVLVIGGSEKYTGAPALAAQAALRSGADLVKVLTSEDAKPVVQGFSENLIVESYGETFDEGSLRKAWELEEWADTTVVGAGLVDFDPVTLKEFAEEAGRLVVDAAAIEPLLEFTDNIFTPHSGEAEAIRQEYGSEKDFAAETGSTVLLKGEVDKVFSEETVFENDTGCAGMTVGGTGDVLAGLVAGFRSQDLADVEASRLAAYVNGRAGEKVFEEHGNGLVATDLLDFIPAVLKE
ncbi:NAD(P)H-hydrate dehydratase [Candidatus Nanohaloarchaea archaeon]|nr:NAD(P)H-hydrate dehydratase [Candidatus Nanohaloarchaea archaeon]